MQPDMARRLEQLRQQTVQLGQRAHEVVAAAPHRSEGVDETGAVRVVLGPTALPTEIRVHDGWQQRLVPDGLGPAVLDANNDAVQRAAAVWGDALDHGRWRDRGTDAQDAGDENPTPADPDLSEPPHGRVRDLHDLTEDVLTALHEARQPVVAPPPDEKLHDRRPVVVELGPGGLSACEIDASWAARRDGAAISAALSDALHRATVERAEASSSAADPGNILGDALATLRSLTTLPPAGGGDR